MLSRVVILGTAVGALVAGTFTPLVDWQSGDLVTIVLAVGVIAVVFVSLTARLANQTFDLFDPLTAGSIVLAVLFGLRPLWVIGEADLEYHGYNIEPSLGSAAFLGLAGVLAFLAGYLVVPRSRTRPRQAEERVGDVPRAYAFAFVVGIVSVGLTLIYLSTGGSIGASLGLLVAGRSIALADSTAGSSEYLSAAPLLTVSGAIAIGVSARWRISAWQCLLLLALVAFPVVTFSLVGNRRFIIPALVVPMVAYFLGTGTRPGKRLVAVVAPLAFLLLATVPFGRAAGAQEAAGGLLPIYQEALTAPDQVWGRFINGPDTEMFSALATEMQLLESADDFYYGRATIGDLVIAPLPSAVFPGKPTTARNQLLIIAFGAPCAQGELCPDFSAIGTFYQDLWLPGVILGMATLGATSAWLWEGLKRPHSQTWEVITAGWIVFLPIILRAGFMPAFSWFLFFTAPCVAGVVLASGRKLHSPNNRIVDE